ncbi:MAG: extracellular solute-binding protein [Planctomycetota bacterium]
MTEEGDPLPHHLDESPIVRWTRQTRYIGGSSRYDLHGMQRLSRRRGHATVFSGSRRRCRAVAVLAAALLVASAAGGQERTLVVMAEDQHIESWPVLEELAAEFEAAHPGLDVRLLTLGGAAGGQDKSRFMLAGDLQLDVMRIDITELAAFIGEGALVDLEPYFAADSSWQPEEYFPSVLDAMRDRRGHLYGLASTFTPYVMYYNRDLLAAAGIPAPRADWTWEEFLDLARRATRDLDGDGRADQHGISLTQWLQAVVPWVWQNGGDLLDPAGERSRMAEPEFVDAMRFLRRLLHEERVASFDASFANQLSQGLFQAGRAAFYGPVGYWETFRFKHIDSFRWDVAPLPRGRTAATAVAMTVYVVPRTAREPELGYQFVRVMAGERYQRAMAAVGNGVPGLIAAARSADFLKPAVAPDSEHVFLDVMDGARFMPPLANWRKIESLCQSEMEGILLVGGAFDVGAACDRMARRTDDYLARERARHAKPRLPRGAMELALAVSFLTLAGTFLLRRGPRPRPLLAREERYGYGMIALWAAGFLLFLVGPAVASLVLSLCEWSPLRDLNDLRWIGLENYSRLGGDPTFRSSLGATALYAALSVPLGLVVAMALAMLLRRESTAASVVRTACYLPAIISPVIIAAVWRFILDSDQGLLNKLLAAAGIDGPPWLRRPALVVPAFVLMSTWSVGTQMLVFLAALKAVDPSLEEAARIDGAGAWRRFLHVTLPALTPVVLFNLITGSIAAFQIFAQPYVMTEGGPGDASRFLVLYLYESGFRHLDMGYASAIAWVLFAILGVLCLVLLQTSRHWVHYAARGR